MKTKLTMPSSILHFFTAMFAVGIMSSAAAADSATAAQPDKVHTDKGYVIGSAFPSYRSFLGIPFAAPPVGPLRWQPPQPHAPWGTRSATAFGSACPQLNGTTVVSANENCLYLNVYTPPSAKKLPVMVFIHGGAFMTGAGSDYDPTLLTQKTNSVVVTFNYRLGAFGFLAHPGLSAEARDKASGQYGLQDQQLALQWVKKNIANFGGDRNNVTVFGESAGGLSICAQMASPTAAGLFDKAIIESGACTLAPIPLPDAEATGLRFGAQLECANVSCLRAQSTLTILTNPVAETSGTGKMWLPAVGGRNSVLPIPPMRAFALGKFNRVPLLNGSNHDEYRLFTGYTELGQGSAITEQQYIESLRGIPDAKPAAVLAEYPLSNYAAPDIAQATAMGDAFFSCGARTTDRLLVQKNVPVYAYEFNDPNAPSPLNDPYMAMLATHSTELPYIFQTANTPLNANQIALSNQMIGYWGNFAARGNPNGPGLPYWPPYSISGDQFQELAPDATKPVNTFSADHKCVFWATQGY